MPPPFCRNSEEISHACVRYSSLAPGAGTLIKIVTDPKLPESQRLDVKKQVRAMTAQDWSILLKAFDEWPFGPDVSRPFLGPQAMVKIFNNFRIWV